MLELYIIMCVSVCMCVCALVLVYIYGYMHYRILGNLCYQPTEHMIIQSYQRRRSVLSCQILAPFVPLMVVSSVNWRRDYPLGILDNNSYVVFISTCRNLNPRIGDILLNIAPFLKVAHLMYFNLLLYTMCLHRCTLSTFQTLTML